jgi:hypothetical protein
MLGSPQSLGIEIVEGEHILQQGGFPMATNAPGLARIVQRVAIRLVRA